MASISPAANEESVNLHLADIRTQVAPGSIAAVIRNSAGWDQRGGEIMQPENVLAVTATAFRL